ncbi:MAG: DNA phosphorothioation-dependent restriction protein DptG [Candidatus Moranbacteria bacterium RIFOXYA12_FULL_35_19]|nr:MAG: ABC transporter related protein [Candidatus Moranbacteria bacterium GW2011_GWF2_35_39]OGI32967.1 MAG: DNA phosphorothioation-dependent restriction protein DptG [Candidatus Moranbacteria bacterium RIFOXYC12_FULL_36_13]OGI36722.1 MAG: DNA phosphorothioation-dependent restriction protein DptG [Candidatus Moranbacteria bacterium RIFOXYA12_FULL_35_19]
MLKIQNLSKKFGGVKAINACSFEIAKGEITALIGPNGSGKTTVFNLISGIIKQDSGKIFFDEKDITNFSVEQISNLGISRVFQQSKLFKNLTVRENLLLAIDNEDTKLWKNMFGLNKMTKEKKEKVSEILKEFGISEIENKTASDLSFGQKRLVELARTILNPHQLLMLDEPVAGVNPKIRQDIIKLLLKLKKNGETILLIEHDMNFTLGLADDIIVMDAGKVIAVGKPNEIKNNKLVLEAYLGN